MSDFSVKWSIEEFLAKTASKEPTPGGGSVAALTCSLGYSLLAMVCEISLGKRGLADREDELRTSLTAALQGQASANALIQEDIEAFKTYMSAWRLPKDAPTKELEMEAAQKLAAHVPMLLATHCLEGLALAARLSGYAHKNIISDAACAAHLFSAALESAILTVRLNIQQADVANYGRDIEEILEAAAVSKNECLTTTCTRLGLPLA
jgi:formiminotetrahydrofolate cyclodeaminase